MREYLRKFRIQEGHSQQNVASKLGITQQYYALIENGERQRDMNFSIISKLAELYRIEPGEVMAMEEEYQNRLGREA